MSLRPGEILINDSHANAHLYMNPLVNGERKCHGLIPRNYSTHPLGCYKGGALFKDVQMPLIPKSEWSARIKQKIAEKSQISDNRLIGNNGAMIPSLDQNGKGYCWAHSTGSACILLRCEMGEPYVGLSPYSCACILKNYADEGGWGAESMDFAMARGYPSEKFWPMQSMESSNDNPKTWANAATHKVTEGWIDLGVQEYDRKLTFEQVATCVLCNVPVVVDFNWWSHSVCAADLVEISSGSFGLRIWNSWGDSWSEQGMGVLEGDKAIPDGAVAPRVILAAPV